MPITVPATFFPGPFQQLIEHSLNTNEAAFVVNTVQLFFYPDIVLIGGLIVYGFLQQTKKQLATSFELLALLVLFMLVKPFAAFLIYFCFLHSLRHILAVLEELKLPYTAQSIKWLIFEALPATAATLAMLAVAYFYWKKELIDTSCMINLFFISLAALTFPHMLLVEGVRLKK